MPGAGDMKGLFDSPSIDARFRLRKGSAVGAGLETIHGAESMNGTKKSCEYNAAATQKNGIASNAIPFF